MTVHRSVLLLGVLLAFVVVATTGFVPPTPFGAWQKQQLQQKQLQQKRLQKQQQLTQRRDLVVVKAFDSVNTIIACLIFASAVAASVATASPSTPFPETTTLTEPTTLDEPDNPAAGLEIEDSVVETEEPQLEFEAPVIQPEEPEIVFEDPVIQPEEPEIVFEEPVTPAPPPVPAPEPVVVATVPKPKPVPEPKPVPVPAPKPQDFSALRKSVASTVEGEREKRMRLAEAQRKKDEEAAKSVLQHPPEVEGGNEFDFNDLNSETVASSEDDDYVEVSPKKKRGIIRKTLRIIKKVVAPWRKWENIQ
mmetsp:Transcript_517/g.888  ORF Transcript_517/g.888 Transcript_517/m.888 type:complete len:306 (-) Transcript_517:140-1057(-)